MRVPKPVFLVKRFAAAVLIVAVTLVAATPAPAAEGPALAPAEYKPLPVGTRINYDNRIYVVSRIDGFSTVYKTVTGGKLSWLSAHALFGEYKDNLHIISSGGSSPYEIDGENKKKLEAFWPLKVGNKVSFRLDELTMIGAHNDQEQDYWRITLEVTKTEAINLNGFYYPAYVIEERGRSDTGKSYRGRKWYQPDAGLIIKSERIWIKSFSIMLAGSYTKDPLFGENQEDNFSLVKVTYPEGTTTHALKGTKTGGAADKALLAEVEKLKQEAEKARKAREAEIARLKREAEEARKAALAGGDKARAAEIARLEKEVEQRHWDSVKDSPELAAVEDYLKRYPSGRFAAEAKAPSRGAATAGQRQQDRFRHL